MERKSIGNSDDIRDINSDIVFPIHMLFIIVLKSGNNKRFASIFISLLVKERLSLLSGLRKLKRQS